MEFPFLKERIVPKGTRIKVQGVEVFLSEDTKVVCHFNELTYYDEANAKEKK